MFFGIVKLKWWTDFGGFVQVYGGRLVEYFTFPLEVSLRIFKICAKGMLAQQEYESIGSWNQQKSF